ncbi:MAG TPA: hypothetical protein VMU51_15445 [Mycobacteriales bacterium]|nr:hypothetical protein [Mycobacteriales bacterium]
MRSGEFVADDFVIPAGLETDRFVLEPLGPQHNEADYAAWTSSYEHIRATPGFADGSWPTELTLAQNRDDLVRHQADFLARRGFTYTVLDAQTREVIGCVYLYPARREGFDVSARSWVRRDRAELDIVLWRAVTEWLRASWPWTAPDYASRG